MANIVITTIGSSIIADFGVYYGATTRIDSTKASFHKNNLAEIHLMSDHVKVLCSNPSETWELTWDSGYGGSVFMIVDSVAGVAPTSQSDLFDKITALR